MAQILPQIKANETVAARSGHFGMWQPIGIEIQKLEAII